MGSMVGHVAPGFGFLVIGLWHLFNHIMLHTRNPSSYTSPLWFSVPKFRYLELYIMMSGSATSVVMELFVGPTKHQPLDLDGTIPSTHLHNFEHSLISSSIFTYAVFAILFDRMAVPTKAHRATLFGLTQLVGSVAFGQELLLFRLHSTDHTGVEGQYHLLLQLLILVSFTTTLSGIAFPKSFILSFVRSASIFAQGIWFIFQGIMLWTPQLIPKGCFMNLEEAHYIVRCHSDVAMHRAKSLANISFSIFLICVTVFCVSLYPVIMKFCGDNIGYQTLNTTDDMESQNKTKILGDEQSRSLISLCKMSS